VSSDPANVSSCAVTKFFWFLAGHLPRRAGGPWLYALHSGFRMLVLSLVTITATGGTVSLNTGLVYHPDYLLHQPGAMHPERPARLTAIVEHLQAVSLWRSLVHIEPQPVADAWLLEVHSADYLRELDRAVEQAPIYLDPDTGISPDSVRVARLAAGGVLAAVDAVMVGRVRNAFAAVRPPGHHALPDRAMGFCLFNNIAVAARYLIKHHGIERVLIVDWDVHHGNGTQAMFYEDPSVLYFSTHQSPYYPGTGSAEESGTGAGAHSVVNVPLPSGTGDEDIVAAFENRLLPAAESFKPQFVLVSAGFDGHFSDPLAQFRLTEEAYARLTRIVLDIAERYADGRLVSMLEGGYDLDALASSVEAHLRALSVSSGAVSPAAR
jgi:acetoin utilization deacetylase AcuC-like enzyme